MFNKKTIRDYDFRGKRVLVRVDFNVPINEGVITDDTRIKAALPTIQFLLQQHAAVILCSHLGRPKGEPKPEFSLRPVAGRLSELLKLTVAFANDCIGPEARKMAGNLKPGEVLLLENTRFYPGETKNNPDFAKELASLADVFVNDAFGTAHRAHASNVGVANYLPAFAGFLLEKEIKYLGNAIANPKRPFVAILGGAKVSDKIGVIRHLLSQADHILIGGGMANTFLRAQGIEMGDSLVESESIDVASKILAEAGDKLHLPIDLVIGDEFADTANSNIIDVGPVPHGWRVMDIGPKSVQAFSELIKEAQTVVWNGPMGVFEFPNFAKGTFGIAKAVAESDADSIIGGGDSVAAIQQSGLADKITHISTGGGASLKMLEGNMLPALSVLQDK